MEQLQVKEVAMLLLILQKLIMLEQIHLHLAQMTVLKIAVIQEL